MEQQPYDRRLCTVLQGLSALACKKGWIRQGQCQLTDTVTGKNALG